jgi:DNA-nicking Smr family endonuclease
MSVPALVDTLRQFVRAAVGVTPTLDLHGLGVRDAVAETERFLRDAQAHGTRQVRIVYGKGRGSPAGRGVLREVIPRWLDTEGAHLVTHYHRQPDASGVDGGALVELRAADALPPRDPLP